MSNSGKKNNNKNEQEKGTQMIQNKITCSKIYKVDNCKIHIDFLNFVCVSSIS